MVLSLIERREKTVMSLEQALKAAVYRPGDEYLMAQI
ncbi:Rha family transcriptional regulator, partial [Acinetobacter baumannii]